MEKLIVLMLNVLGKGTFSDVNSDLMLSPAQYNASLYKAAQSLHDTAVLPVTGVVLSIIAVLALAQQSSKFDTDGELGIRMLAAVMFRVTMTLLVCQASMKVLQAIDEVTSTIAKGANGMNVGNTPTGQALGDSLSGQIADAGVTKQLVMIVMLLLPFLFASVVWCLATVLVFVRFLQIYVMTCFASLPLAFFGNDATKGIAMGYVKRYAVVSLQAVVLIISLKLYQALMAGWLTGTGKIDKGTDVFQLIVDHMGQFFVGPLVLAFVLFTSTSVARSIVGEG